MKKLKNERGVLLVVFIVAIVINSMLITTAFYDYVDVETARREDRTWQKMLYCYKGVTGGPFQVMNESGSDITYINETAGFPATMAAFVAGGYLKHFGMTSGSYAPELDAFGDAITMTDDATTFTIASPNHGDNIPITMAPYETVSVRILVQDADGSHDLSPAYFNLTNTRIYDVGTTDTVSALVGLGPADSGVYTASVPVGYYEIRFEENDTTYPDWLTDTMEGYTDEVRVPIWIYPETSATAVNKTIQLPFHFPEDLP